MKIIPLLELSCWPSRVLLVTFKKVDVVCPLQDLSEESREEGRAVSCVWHIGIWVYYSSLKSQSSYGMDSLVGLQLDFALRGIGFDSSWSKSLDKNLTSYHIWSHRLIRQENCLLSHLRAKFVAQGQSVKRHQCFSLLHSWLFEYQCGVVAFFNPGGSPRWMWLPWRFQ